MDKEKHNEDLKAAKGWIEIAKKNNNELAIQILKNLFPELSESEDEQHRKWILEYLYDGLQKSDEQFKGQFKTAIAWLEKQSKQNYIDADEDWYGFVRWFVKERTDNYTLIPSDDDIHNWGNIILNHARKLIEKQCEKTIPKNIDDAALQYVDTCAVDGEVTHDNITEPYWNNHSMMNAYKAGWLEKTLGKVEGYQSDDGILEHKCAISAVKKLAEHKSWSEEDEKMLDNCIGLIQEIDSTQEEQDWLKSFKNKVQSQPKQEWSEEDEANMDYSSEVIGFLNNYIKTYGRTAMNSWVNWLKSLKPQKHWKPSEYDISLLEEIARNIRNDVRPFCSEVSSLESLIDNLKKL